MFCLKKKVVPVIAKPGTPYSSIKEQIAPLDLILFRGNDVVSKTIQYLSGRELGAEAKKYSHCGVIITHDILPIAELTPGKLYIFESTMSGDLADGVKNIQGKSFLGCQVRDFDMVIAAYDKPANTQVNWCQLIDNPTKNKDNKELINFMQLTMKRFYESHNGKRYTINLFQLFAAMFPSLRICRPKIFMHEFIFCSELAAMLYKTFGVIEGEPANVVPADFAVADEDRQVDCTKWNHTLITNFQVQMAKL